MQRRSLLILFLAFLVTGLVSAGCAPHNPAPGDTGGQISTAVPLPTHATPSAQPSASPSATPSPTPTSTTTEPTLAPTRTPAPTETPTPRPFAVVQDPYLPIYTGPDEVFKVLLTLTKGMAVDLVGQDALGDWFYVDLLFGQGGWIAADAVLLDGDPAVLEVLETPAVPTRTPAPDLSPSISFDNTDNAATLYLFNFKLHETVIITVTRVDDPSSAKSRNCTVTDPEQSVCKLWWANFKPDTTFMISAIGDQGSTAQTTYTR